MFDFKSRENYESLKKFFSPEYAQLRPILASNQFSHEHMQQIYKELSDDFCQDFFACLDIARAQFLPSNLLVVLEEFYKHLKGIHEPVECVIVLAKEAEKQAKIDLEKSLNEKFAQYGKLNIIYEQDATIIGGIVIKLAGKYYDGSFKNILFNIQSSVQKEIA